MDLKISDFILLDVEILEASMNFQSNEKNKERLTQFTHKVGIGHEINLKKNILYISIDVDLISNASDNIVARFKTSIAFGFGHLNLKFDTSNSKFPFSKKLCADKSQELVVSSSETHEAIQTHAWKLVRSTADEADIQLLFKKPDDRWEVNDVHDRCPNVVPAINELLDRAVEELQTDSTMLTNGSLRTEIGTQLST